MSRVLWGVPAREKSDFVMAKEVAVSILGGMEVCFYDIGWSIKFLVGRFTL